MSTGFVYLRPTPVVCARAVGPYSRASTEAWRQIFAWLDDAGMRRSIGCGYGLLRDNPAHVPESDCRYDACVELMQGFENTVPAGFRMLRLPGGAHARQRKVGVEGLQEVIKNLRDNWVPARGLCIDASRPFLEIYLDDPASVRPEKARIDICIPVTNQAQRERTAA